MKQITSKVSVLLAFIYVFAMSLSSCSSSESVVSNGFLQKRKYNKGFHRSKKNNVKVNSKANEEVLVLNNANSKEIEANVESENISINVEDVELTDANLDAKLVVEEVSLIEPSVEEVSVTRTKALKTIENKVEKVKSTLSLKKRKTSNTASTESDADTMFILLIILAFIIPPLAVGIHTNIDWLKVLIAFLLWSTFFAFKPLLSLGIIYALLVIFDIL